jgi:mono/diheme cytochrome c family protein
MANNFKYRDNSRGTEPEAFSDPKIGEVHTQLAREKQEPREGFSGVPILVVFLFCALGFWGSVYFIKNAGAAEQKDAQGNVVHPNMRFSAFAFETSAPALKTGPVEPKTVDKQIKDGEKLFAQNCSTCHQLDGKGVAGSFPPLAGSAWVHGAPDRVIKIAQYGIAGEIEVNGHKFNGAMADMGAGLNDQKLADLITYVRQAWGNKADPVDVDTVKAVRAATPKRGPWTPAEILSQHPLEK